MYLTFNPEIKPLTFIGHFLNRQVQIHVIARYRTVKKCIQMYTWKCIFIYLKY